MTDSSTSVVNVDNFLDKYKNTTEIVKEEEKKEVIVLKEELLRTYSAELVDFLLKQTKKYKDFNMAQITLKQIVEVKKAFFPATQKSIVATGDIFKNQLVQWIEVAQNIDNTKNREEIKNEILVTVDNSYKEDEVDKNGGK